MYHSITESENNLYKIISKFQGLIDFNLTLSDSAYNETEELTRTKPDFHNDFILSADTA